MLMQSLPRHAVRLSLTTARLPLSAAEVVLGHADDQEWPPTLAFEAFESSVKRVVGGLLRDEALIDEGRLGEAKVTRLRQAADLETVAEQRRQEAESTFQERRDEDRAQREQAENEARERKAALAREENEAKQKAAAKAQRKAKAASDAEAATEKAIERKARRARVQELSQEEQALAKAQAATSKARAAKTVDKRLQASKAARSNGR